VDSTSPQTLYLGARDGIYKSTDGGTTWNNVGTGFPAGAVAKTILVDPVAPATLYAATPGNGVYKSVDGGVHWAAINNGAMTSTTGVNALVMDPGSSATLYAGSLNGAMLKTTDGGATWITITAGLPTPYPQVIALAVAPSSPGTLYATLYFYGGLYKSVNGGGTWAAASNALPGLQWSSGIAIDPGNSSIVYYSPGESGIYKSVDGTATWSPINAGFLASSVYAVAFDPADATGRTIWAGTFGHGVLESTNAGGSWVARNTGISAVSVSRTVHVIAFASAGMLAVTDGGAYLSTDHGTTWNQVPSVSNEAYSLAVDGATRSVVFCGGIEGMFVSTDGGASFRPSDVGLTTDE